ncbi:Rrf2 family transcriptional regulator [Paenibacillus sp. ACRSA]|uniref:Rrf2 family transcriptional regulator n=1 Tax=Paenibacillus sp. ACRSA TaxID=2918211 RepID=UPI001EF6A812|nr:Rrf2 family transcriptional regulator [Paenibacillus sp. ACRSA]MCG7378712.1 Rrf2 family transcriptional regulator [Paenibacillus sp. ACRSA]
MSINTRFSVGIHILAFLEINTGSSTSSENIAKSVNTNPAVIRKIMGMLKKADLIHVRPGIAGASLTRSISEITLFDICEAVNTEKDRELFNMHKNPDPDCNVGKYIEDTLEPIFGTAQRALEKTLQNVTIADIINDISNQQDQPVAISKM